MNQPLSWGEIEGKAAADKAEKFIKLAAKVEAGKLFAVRLVAGKQGDRDRQYVKRLGGQWEPVSKLWVIRASAANMDAYANLIDAPGVVVLSGAEYKAAYNAARA